MLKGCVLLPGVPFRRVKMTYIIVVKEATL